MRNAVTFLHISLKPNTDLELDSIFGKPMNCWFQWYIVHTEILSNFHARVEYISVKQMRHWNQWRLKPPEIPFPLGARGPRLIHHPSPYQRASGSTRPFCHNTLRTERPTHRHTHSPTDGIGDRSVRTVRTLAMLIESDALIIIILYTGVWPTLGADITHWHELINSAKRPRSMMQFFKTLFMTHKSNSNRCLYNYEFL